MDPDEFIRCLLPLCKPLSNICEIHVKESLSCAAQVEATDNCPAHTCSDVKQQTVPHIGLQLFIKEANTIANIIQENTKATVQSDCTKCKTKNANKYKIETFESLPEIIFVKVKRFQPVFISGRFRNDKNSSKPANHT